MTTRISRIQVLCTVFHKVEKQVLNERLKVTTQKKIKQKVDSPQNELEYAVNNDEGK